MAKNLRYDGRVVIVTGAGGGIGRIYAHFFASRGASVVVNDLGSPRTGGPRAADIVVEEIQKLGGKTIANYDSVEDGDKIVETAMKTFGRVDIIVNNAGILRDKSFARMTDEDWDLVHAVHVRGSYKVTKAAWSIMQKQKYGKIIMTASAAGIYGNYGQANYSAAKIALIGLSSTLAREGAKYNIQCNCIAPIAASRMTETVMPPEILAAIKPEFVAPLVGYLSHESTTETGGLFEVGAGFVAKLRWERSKGVVFKTDDSFTPASAAAKWDQVCDFSNPDYPSSIVDTDWLGLLEQAKLLSTNPNPTQLRFDGKVVLVTGAGAGLGRAYAHLFAKLGASVVVNDIGSAVTGGGGNSRAADIVVNEIKEMGGIAVANYDSVEDGDKVVATAIQHFGRIDVIVNNAGILRDKSFSRMTDQDWDLAYRVHLKRSYKISKAAWPHMLKNKYGRIINTSSAVGLYGNFGQANYSAAKSGIIGLSNTLALEGKKHNIIVNTIAPNAGTRMTATIMPSEMVEALKPEYVAPLVVYLGHESTRSSGGIFETGSGWISKVRWQQSGGYGFPHNKVLAPEYIAAKWDVICNFDDGRATHPTSAQDSFQKIYANVTNVTSDDSSAGSEVSEKKLSSVVPAGKSFDIEKARNAKFEATTFVYTERDVILYALGVGATRSDLDLVYENNEKFFSLPTYGVIMAFGAMNSVPLGEFLPQFNPMMLLHGEQYLEIGKPIPTSAKVLAKPRIIDICDKGKGAVVTIGVSATDTAGNEIAYAENTLFIRGITGFGGPKERTNVPKPEAIAINEIPSRAPDAVIKEKTSENQAAIYRLSGDWNPLHIDPQMSAIGGFEVPILHGLCTFGIAGKHILRKYGNSDPKSFKSIKARFAKHVFPGETLQTEMWKEGSKILFQVRVIERNVIAISNAAVELRSINSSVSTSSKSDIREIMSGAAGDLKSSALFKQIKAGLEAMNAKDKQAQIKKTNGVFQFDITKSGNTQSFHIDLKYNGTAGVGPATKKPDVVITVADDDFADLASGKLNGQKAFMSGKIKVKGKVMLATKLDAILKTVQKSPKL